MIKIAGKMYIDEEIESTTKISNSNVMDVPKNNIKGYVSEPHI